MYSGAGIYYCDSNRMCTLALEYITVIATGYEQWRWNIFPSPTKARWTIKCDDKQVDVTRENKIDDRMITTSSCL